MFSYTTVLPATVQASSSSLRRSWAIYSRRSYLDKQRSAHIRRMRELTDLRRNGALVDVLLADHALFHLEADLRWIDLTSARLAELAAVVTPERAPDQ